MEGMQEVVASSENDGNPNRQESQRDTSMAVQEKAFKDEEAELHESNWKVWNKISLHRARSFAKYFPLIAATLAPFSTLMDIPALSEHWYQLYGVVQSDYKACIALSALGLALNLFANILLIIRFSSSGKNWSKISTLLSTIFWVGKTLVAMVNLFVFGILIRQKPGFAYREAFWCAVVSVTVAGVIALSLMFHYVLVVDHDDKGSDATEVRLEGRKFMLSVTLFMVILGFQSLAFSRLEGWSYSDAIYFSTQTALTIGYGDLLPTTTASKVLVFMFSVLTISQLGNEISLIISFISARATARRDKWRARYEGAMHREANALRPKATLLEEMSLIYEINSREELMNQMVDLFWSAVSLVVFWVVGATTFSEIEGWTYGNALYAVMVLSLTIGFGDFAPITPAGRVVFIVYALMAVPIVTSFAVQTITGLLSTFSTRGEIKHNFLQDRMRNPTAFKPHADYVLRAHESYGEMRARLLGQEEKRTEEHFDLKELHDQQHDNDDTPSDSTVVDEAEGSSPKRKNSHLQAASESHGKEGKKDRYTGLNPIERLIKQADDEAKAILAKRRSRESVAHLEEEEDENDPDGNVLNDEDMEADQLSKGIIKKLMTLTIMLEAEARQMLLDCMDKGVARTLLLADRNVQARDVKSLRGDNADMLAIWRGEDEKLVEHRKLHQNETSSQDLLSRVSRYRNTFASILVLGSILQELSGEDVNKFERWRGKQQMTDSPQNESLMHTDIERVASEQFPGLTGMMFRRHRDELRKSSMVESVKGKRDRMEGHLGKRSKTMSESSGKGPKETMKNSLKQMRSTTMG